MIVSARIVDGTVTPAHEAHAMGAIPPDTEGSVGAMVRFAGIVRALEPSGEPGGSHRELAALDYTTYDPMAQREMESLARDVALEHGLVSIVVVHSRGWVPVGEVSFVLVVCAPHRAETLAAVAGFIDRLKRDVPIWKSPVWAT